MSSIYIDESGNTGSNLLDVQQPVFTTASCNFTDEEAAYLLSKLATSSVQEAHFKRLRKSARGRKGIVELLTDDLVNKERVKVQVIHKEFMVLTKIVDILLEFFYHHILQIDLYKHGRNIALSNMLYACIPTFCGEQPTKAMYAAFVEMVLQKDEAAIDAFYAHVQTLHENCIHEPFKKDLNLLLATRSIAAQALANMDKFAIDPCIPALFLHCAQWGNTYPTGFTVFHDDSNALEQQQHMVTQFMDWSKQEITAGYDRRKFDLPLKARAIHFVCSKQVKQVQVMDVLASALAHWAGFLATNTEPTEFWQQLDEVGFNDLIGHNKIWHQLIVSPKGLGTVHDGGTNPLDASVAYLNS